MVRDYSTKTKNLSYDKPGCEIDSETDVLNDDNLIPIPPTRPHGTIQVRLKSALPDKPTPPSEDEISLTNLDDL